jgi:hypothetical protein
LILMCSDLYIYTVSNIFCLVRFVPDIF